MSARALRRWRTPTTSTAGSQRARTLGHEIFVWPASFDADAIRAWFVARGRYSVTGDIIRYANDDTDFAFALQIVIRPEPGASHIWISVDYLNPHTLALEAVAEVEALLEAFGGRASTTETTSGAPFSREATLAAWTAAAHEYFSKIDPPRGDREVFPADPAHIEAIWTWNGARAAMQAAAGRNIFVPKVCWVRQGSSLDVHACITWNFGIPTIIPDSLVSRLVLVRQPRSGIMQAFARRKPEAQPELKLLNVDAGIRLKGVEPYTFQGHDVLLTPPTGSLEVQSLFLGPWPKTSFSIIPQNRVCGADLVELLENR
jgi:hypothetical protein